MLFQNLGYQWGTYQRVVDHVDGFILQAATVDRVLVDYSRSSHDVLQSGSILFDPQMYMAQLPSEIYTTVISRLATYPWFLSNAPAYDSDEMSPGKYRGEVARTKDLCVTVADKESMIKRSLESCLDFQQHSIGATHYIIPTPLIARGDLDCQMSWIDLGLEVFPEGNSFVSIAASERIFDNALCDVILDNLLARAVNGVYLVLVRQSEELRLCDPVSIESILRLCQRGSSKGLRIVVNFLDDFGLMCIAAGASGFGTGYSRKERRLAFSDWSDKDGFGYQFPTLYSLAFLAEFLSQADINERFAEGDLLWLLENDWTRDSEPLRIALESGRSANDVPEWRQTDKNTLAAVAHRASLLKRTVDELLNLDIDVRQKRGLSLLREAQRNSVYLHNELDEDDRPSIDLRHIALWLDRYVSVV